MTEAGKGEPLDTTEQVPGEPEQPPTPDAAVPEGAPLHGDEPNDGHRGPGTVTLDRGEYDALKQGAAAAESLGRQLQDPAFIDALVRSRLPVTPADAVPVDDAAFNDNFYNAPGKSIDERVDQRVRAQYLPEIQKQARSLRFTTNKLAIGEFKNRKRETDDLASYIMPIFDKEFVAKFTDEWLASNEQPMEPMLESAWEMASNRYLRSRRTVQVPPKDTAPPIAGSPVGQARGTSGEPKDDDPEFQALLALGAQYKWPREKVVEKWKEARAEEAANA